MTSLSLGVVIKLRLEANSSEIQDAVAPVSRCAFSLKSGPVIVDEDSDTDKKLNAGSPFVN